MILALLSLFLIYPLVTFAHCPLCIGGVLVLTFLVYEIGVKKLFWDF